MRRVMRAVGLAGLATLAACHGHTVQRSDDQRTAEGQVLKGSISDAMLPYDAGTSEPPLAAAKVKSAVADSSVDQPDGPGAAPQPAPTAAPDAAAPPSADASPTG